MIANANDFTREYSWLSNSVVGLDDTACSKEYTYSTYDTYATHSDIVCLQKQIDDLYKLLRKQPLHCESLL